MARPMLVNSARPSRRVGRTVFGRSRSRFTGQLMGRCLAAPNTCSGNWNRADSPSGGPAPIPKRKDRRRFTCIAACRVREAPATAFHRANRDVWVGCGPPQRSTMSVPGELITETFEYDGGRAVTVYV